MKNKSFFELKKEIQLQTKKGVDFILSAGIIWLIITLIWTLDYPDYTKSVFTFMVGAGMLPLAFGLSKIIHTNWKVKNNPLQPLGLWLNFAQLIYFPFLFFILLKSPGYFVMTYAIITGAHLFPYAWLYDEVGYAIWAVLISIGALLLALFVPFETSWMVPLYTSVMLLLLAGWIFMRQKGGKRHRN